MALADDAKDAVAVFFAEVADIERPPFEDAQSEQPEQAHKGEVAGVVRRACGGEQRFELQVTEPEGW